MGCGQYAILDFFNDTTDYTLGFAFPDIGSHWGYPFAGDDERDRGKIDYDTIRAHTVAPGTNWSYGQTGKQNGWEGVEGRVNLLVQATGGANMEWQKIGAVFYSCPWSGSNVCNVEGVDAFKWEVIRSGYSTDGALGSIQITVRSRQALW